MQQPPDFPLPLDLPVPVDDGSADHLKDKPLPRIALSSTFGRKVVLSQVGSPSAVIYCYPMTGVPGRPLPKGRDLIPGARGCTPLTCNFRNRFQEFLQLKVDVFALGTQTTDYQLELVKRLNVPFEILSDSNHEFCEALRLPTFQVEGMRLLMQIPGQGGHGSEIIPVRRIGLRPR